MLATPSSPSRRAGHSAHEVPHPILSPKAGHPPRARSLAPAGAPARRCSAEPWDGACSCILPPEPGIPSKGPPRAASCPATVRKPSFSQKKNHTRLGRFCPGGKPLEGKHLPAAGQLGSPFPPRTLPACRGFLPGFEGRSSPVCSRSAGEHKTNGLICAKSRLQLQHLLFSSSQYFIPLQIRMNAILLLKSFSVLYAEVNAVCPAICIFKGISNTGFLFHRENKIDLRAKPE